jgi:hypothetical protein
VFRPEMVTAVPPFVGPFSGDASTIEGSDATTSRQPAEHMHDYKCWQTEAVDAAVWLVASAGAGAISGVRTRAEPGAGSRRPARAC